MSAVEEYLDRLGPQLQGPPEHVRRLLAEAGDHLGESAETLVAQGLDDDAAGALAVARFGSVDTVARSMNRATWGRYRRPLLLDAMTTLAGLAAAGLVAVGVTGIAARVVAALTSTTAVYGYPSGVDLPAGSCGHWLAVQPAATSCAQAAGLEAASDLTVGSVLAGLLGLALAAALLLRRRRRTTRPVRLPRVLAPALATAAFVLAAAGAAVLGAGDAVVLGTWGSGLFWTAAGVGLVSALLSGAGTLRALPAGLSSAG